MPPDHEVRRVTSEVTRSTYAGASAPIQDWCNATIVAITSRTAEFEASPATSSDGSKVILPAAPAGGGTVGQEPGSAGWSPSHHGRATEHPASVVATTHET